MHIPIELAMTASAALADPHLGEAFRRLQGGEFVTLALYILQQKKKEDSKWAPWLRAIPPTSELPILHSWKEDELYELKGSPLLDALGVRRSRRAPLGILDFRDWHWIENRP